MEELAQRRDWLHGEGCLGHPLGVLPAWVSTEAGLDVLSLVRKTG